MQTQLTLNQHRSNVCIHANGFVSIVIYDSAAQSEDGWIWGCGSTDMEDLGCRGLDDRIFNWGQKVCATNPHPATPSVV